ncbi:hypothetical protein BD324DRAFT_622458 [Kockovaella imperatae]|uniref:P-loop containing nucleoside triphosphate hydrolase protein n=1 Tax=Kockovaella imperatae TaxID=4999 RepID=A0A1Y1UHP6_9TREE|nr:hypothetical protein BD324DRAFT_622458 [Kockovaella imperatae]ORX37568.1 hypothetical protein BD324DRAFT_622458 [Kockovaella imperatae]
MLCVDGWIRAARFAAHAGPSTLRTRQSWLASTRASGQSLHTSALTRLEAPTPGVQEHTDGPDRIEDEFFRDLEADIDERESDSRQVSTPASRSKRSSKDEKPVIHSSSWDLRPQPEEAFDDVVSELLRRKKKTEMKRMQQGGFLDHITVQIRGGRGGHGAAAFTATSSGTLGPASGGNGGQGGSVYLKTSPTLTSLHSISRRINGGPGGNGKGDTLHGRPGTDVVIEVPVGTVVREIRRKPDPTSKFAGQNGSVQFPTSRNLKIAHPLASKKDSADILEVEEDFEALDKGDEADNQPMSEQEKKAWDRTFVLFPGAEFTRAEYRRAERALKKGGRAEKPPPTFEQEPPKTLDLEVPVTGDPILLARGGHGGMGNPFFFGFSGYRQPRIAGRGTIPYTSTYEFELKLLADVGLVGFPNVGKSTILRALTGRRAEVADYSFTTLNPQIGVVRVWNDGTFGDPNAPEGRLVVEDTWKERDQEAEGRLKGEYQSARGHREVVTPREDMEPKYEVARFTISDNPGLLPLASENVGLGHSFLRSIERSLALAYVLDITRPDPAADLMTLRNELDTYKEGLTSKGTVIILNKGDKVDEQVGRERFERVKDLVATLPEAQNLEVTVLSGKFGLGMKKMVQGLRQRVEQERAKTQERSA